MKIKSSEPPADYILRLQRLKSLPLKLHLQVMKGDDCIDLSRIFLVFRRT